MKKEKTDKKLQKLKEDLIKDITNTYKLELLVKYIIQKTRQQIFRKLERKFSMNSGKTDYIITIIDYKRIKKGR